MAKLSFTEKNIIEKLLYMDEGYVSNFSNRTFQLFIGDFFNIDIYDEKYSTSGTSKANRLRVLMGLESEYVVGTILEGLLANQIALDAEPDPYSGKPKPDRSNLYEQARVLIARLKAENPVDNLDAIKPLDEGSKFTLLCESVRKSIEQDEPVNALDRLHTYMVGYVRRLCQNHGISYDEKQPLNSLLGGYVKKLREDGIVESGMTLQILGAHIKLLDEFNAVRNNQSLAHDNDLINNNEALLILNSMTSFVRFVDALESDIRIKTPNK